MKSFSREIDYKNVCPPRIKKKKKKKKKMTLSVATRYNTGLLLKLFRFPNPVVEHRNILIKSMGIEVIAKNHLQPPKAMFLPEIILKITI